MSVPIDRARAVPVQPTRAIALGLTVVACWFFWKFMLPQVALPFDLFVTRDVAAIYLLGAAPLMWCLFATFNRRFARPVGLIVVLGALLTGGFFIVGPLRLDDLKSAGLIEIHVLRMLVASCLICVPITLILVFNLARQIPHATRHTSIREWIFCAVVIAVVPAVYVQARCHQDAMMLAELVDQARVGEALDRARTLKRLMPAMKWRGRSLQTTIAEIEQQVGGLESCVATPLTPDDSPESVLLRSQQLAMLGRSQQAINTLDPLIETTSRGRACLLIGLILESNNDWGEAMTWHQRARDAWKEIPESQERTNALLQVCLRSGYCERKQGRYEFAAAEYSQAIAIAPTAETHFVVAQFYEDMQQSGKAYDHARQAMALAPRRYQRDGQKLIDKLIVSHFGCLNIFGRQTDSRRPLTSPAVGTSHLK